MADDETILALEHEMSVLIRRLRRRIALRARMVHPDLAPVAYSMLMALHDGGPQRASALVELFAVDKGAISRQVSALLELGLIERTPDPDDRRAAILALTAQGLERMEAVAHDRRAEFRERLGDWTQDELRSFVAVMSRYNTSLETG